MEPLPPTPPRRPKVSLVEKGDALTLTFADASFGGMFLVVWLAGWTVACGFLAREAIRAPQPMTILFAVPFWASWIFVATVVARTGFRRSELRLDTDGAALVRRLSPARQRRVTQLRAVPLREILSIRFAESRPNGDGPPRFRIEFVTLGKGFMIEPAADINEKQWLAHRLQEHLATLRGWTGEVPGSGDDQENCRDCPAPSDCAWEERFEGGTVEFSRRGRFELAKLGMVLFAAIFWNGIVAFFLGVLIGMDMGPLPRDPIQPGMWWFMCLFLIPFELIGIALIAGIPAALLAPWLVTRWRFSDGGAEHFAGYGGIGWTWRYGAGGRTIEQLSLLGDARSAWKRYLCSRNDEEEAIRFGLAAADRDGAELCRVTGLTRGEALWMKGRLQEALFPPR